MTKYDIIATVSGIDGDLPFLVEYTIGKNDRSEKTVRKLLETGKDLKVAAKIRFSDAFEDEGDAERDREFVEAFENLTTDKFQELDAKRIVGNLESIVGLSDEKKIAFEISLIKIDSLPADNWGFKNAIDRNDLGEWLTEGCFFYPDCVFTIYSRGREPYFEENYEAVGRRFIEDKKEELIREVDFDFTSFIDYRKTGEVFLNKELGSQYEVYKDGIYFEN